MWRRVLVLVGSMVVAVLAAAGVARAATFTVNTTTDSSGACAGTAPCSLREAVEGADAAGGASTIVVPAGTYTLTIPSAGQNDPSTGDLDIQSGASVTIEGAGAGATTVDANYLDRAFTVQSGASLSLSGLTVENGSPSSNSTGSGSGGAIYADGPLTLSGVNVEDSSTSGTSTAGGAIYVNNGALSVTGSSFLDNSSGGDGGAILDSAAGNLNDDRFVDNTALQAGAVVLLGGASTLNGDEFDGNVGTQGYGAAAIEATSTTSVGSSFIGNRAGPFGGAILLAGNASLVDATISDNQASEAGGLLITNGPNLTLTNDTIAFNTATSNVAGGVGDTSSVGAGTVVQNTIVADNSGGDCSNGGGASQFPAAADGGHNLDSDGSCFSGDGQATDRVSANPLLDGPSDNGGSVLTDALTPGSPAIDAGTASCSPATDARGVARPQGPACDIGAYEYAASTLSLTNSAPATANTGLPFAYTITASASGPGPSTATTVTDQLPAGATLYGSSASQGTCTSAGTPAKVTCALGLLPSGAGATVSLVVGFAQPGAVSDTAGVSNDEGSAPSASASTLVKAPVAPAGATAPTALTGTGFGGTRAELSGRVLPGGQPTAYFFELGTSRSYGMLTAVQRTGSSAQPVSAVVTNLKPGTLYHFRLVAINDSGTSFGADHTFRTIGGKVQVEGSRVTVRGGKVAVPFRCASATACRGRFVVVAHTGGGHGSVLCAQSHFSLKARQGATVTAPVRAACATALRSRHGGLSGYITADPASAQAGVLTQPITLVLG